MLGRRPLLKLHVPRTSCVFALFHLCPFFFCKTFGVCQMLLCAFVFGYPVYLLACLHLNPLPSFAIFIGTFTCDENASSQRAIATPQSPEMDQVAGALNRRLIAFYRQSCFPSLHPSSSGFNPT